MNYTDTDEGRGLALRVSRRLGLDELETRFLEAALDLAYLDGKIAGTKESCNTLRIIEAINS